MCRALTGRERVAVEPHHFDYANKGMGIKGRDHYICRLCREHHDELQGKGRIWFGRHGRFDVYTAMLEDATNLLSDYVLAHKKEGDRFNQDVF